MEVGDEQRGDAVDREVRGGEAALAPRTGIHQEYARADHHRRRRSGSVRVRPGKARAEQHDHGAVAPRRSRLLRPQRRLRADARAQQQEQAAIQRTPPMRLRTGLINRAITSPAPMVTAAVAPNKVGSGVVLMKPADQPASLLPRAFERKNTPIMRPTIRAGASFVTTDRPTG